MWYRPSPRTRKPIISSEPPKLTLPTIDIFLDPSIIPNLPCGETLGHADLMGRGGLEVGRSLPNPTVGVLPKGQGGSGDPPSVPTSRGRRGVPGSKFVRIPTSVARQFAGVGAGGAGGAGLALAVGAIRRVPSLEAPRLSDVGTGTRSSLERTRGHTRTASDSGVISRSAPGTGGKLARSLSTEERVGVVAPDSGAQPTDVPISSKGVGAVECSDEFKTNPRHRPAMHEPTLLSVSASPPPDCLTLTRLDRSSDLLSRIYALTPPPRMPDFRVPHPSSGHLHPSALLDPLAIILEALVVERSVLRDHLPGPDLPVVQGRSFRLCYGSGEIDWPNLCIYITELSYLLVAVFPLLQHSEKAHQTVHKAVRAYITKQKKVFGQIAEMYMDQYSFVRGWWDEGGMKSCATEVGKWGELVDP